MGSYLEVTMFGSAGLSHAHVEGVRIDWRTFVDFESALNLISVGVGAPPPKAIDSRGKERRNAQAENKKSRQIQAGGHFVYVGCHCGTEA